jgi:hypothetical protein
VHLSRESEVLQAQVLRDLCDSIGDNYGLMLLLGHRSAEERVAACAVDLSKRLLAYGRPWSEFTLWMTRAEIGSFLGIKLETVSRVLSKLDEQGLVAVRGRHIQIRDFDALRKLIGGDDHHVAGRRAAGGAPRTPPLAKNENARPEPRAARMLAKSIVERAATMSAAASVRAADRALER